MLSDIPILEEPKHTNVKEGKSTELNVPNEYINAPTTMDEVGNSGNDSGPIQITSVDTEAVSTDVRQKLRVKKTRSSTVGQGSTSYTSVNGDITKLNIMEIEENFEPPRSPLFVGLYMGNEGLGCDVLSFNLEEDRDGFKNNDCRDLRLVERFVEAKPGNIHRAQRK